LRPTSRAATTTEIYPETFYQFLYYQIPCVQSRLSKIPAVCIWRPAGAPTGKFGAERVQGLQAERMALRQISSRPTPAAPVSHRPVFVKTIQKKCSCAS